MISVYDIGNENFRQNGDVILKPTEGKMRVIAGGDYSLTMTHPIDAEGKWKHIAPGAILKIPVPEERIENAFAGYAQDIYKTTAEAQLREGPSAPSTISYAAWVEAGAYEIGDKVSFGNKNYECTYYDRSNIVAHVIPSHSDWWKEIPRQTSGAAVLATLPTGTELYFIEDVDATWIKLSTYYGLEGYVLKSQVTFDRHVDPSEVQPRIIDDQLFRMEQPTVDTKNRTVTVTAKHVSYDLAGNLVQKVSLSQAAPAMAIGKMVEGLMMPYRGTIATNLTAEDNGTYTGEIKGKNGIFALLDPDKGIVSTFGAEYRRDNWDIFIMTKTETDRGFRIRYRKNMLGVNWNRDSSKIANRIVPVAKNEKGEELYLPEKWVDSPDIADYPVIKMEMLQVSGQVGKDKGLGDDSKWTEADLLEEMRTKAAERFTVDHADETEETVTIDFEQLGSTEEYAALKGLEKVLLYDKVEAENKEIGLTRKLYVTELEFDFVKEKVTALKLTNAVQYKKGTVTGFSVQNKSIGSDKLADDVTSGIISQVREIIPEYAAPYEQTLHVNTKDQDGYVLKGQGQAGKVWKTDSQGNPAWRDEQAVSGFIPTSEKGAVGGVAELDQAGKVPAGQLPSYVDDVLEYATKNNFPATGETGKVYVAIDTGKTYRWSGSAYIELSTTAVTDSDPTLAWGTRSKVASVAGTDIHVTMPGNPASASDSDPTLAWNTRSKIGTVNGVDLHVTMPANPNTDHYDWSDITNKPSYYDAKAVKSISRSGTTFTVTCMDGTTFTFTQQDTNTTYSAGNGLNLSGTEFSAILSKSGGRFGCIPWIGTDGVMEVGKYIDFHLTDGDTGDRAQRMTASSSDINFSGGISADDQIVINNNKSLRLYGAGPTSDSWIKFQDTNNTTTFIGIRRPISTYGPTYYDATSYWTMLHAGNYKNYGYLPQLGNYYGNTHNLNDVTCGMALINASTVNSPSTKSGFVGYFISFNVLSSYITQIVIPYHLSEYTEGFYVRTYNDDGWKAWKFIGSADRTAVTGISRSGTTFTATRANGNTFTFTQQDNDTLVNIDGTNRQLQIRTGSNINLVNNTVKTVNFATAFPNVCMGVCVFPTNSFGVPSTLSVNAYDKNGFRVYETNGSAAGMGIWYIAFGY